MSLHKMQLDCVGHLSASFQVIPKKERPEKLKRSPVLVWNARAVYVQHGLPSDMLETATDDAGDFWRWWDIWLQGDKVQEEAASD